MASTDSATDVADGGGIAAEDPKEDDELESKESALLRYFLQEWEVVKAILDRTVANGGVQDPFDVHKIRSILDKYQEQGQLLEPYLECIISPLMLIIRSKTMQLDSTSDGDFEAIKPLCIIIYTLVNICGYKSIVRFFPHQVSDLELAVTLLEKGHQASSSTSLRQESTGEMETKCIVLLWLYILVLIPFDISTVDTSISDGYQLGSEPPPLVTRILEISKDYLSSAGPMRRMSGLLLARLLTRPDMSNAFTSFIDWTHMVLSSSTEDITDHFRLLGVVEALASIFKVGGRKILLNVVTTIQNDVFLLMKSTVAVRSPLLRKLLVKLAQRVGLTCLPRRSPSWRYVHHKCDIAYFYANVPQAISFAFGLEGALKLQGKNSLLKDNLLINDAGNASTCNYNQDAFPYSDPQLTNFQKTDDMDVPEVIEEILELLLSSLRDSDTVVRWSAAKGVGRITACLTCSLAEEVLSSVLELFSPGEGDGSWHGGCLALAELARRGLLLPAGLPKVVPVIIKALHYDVRRGPHSIGSHVRDAAAYVCWAFGRAYSNTDMRGILELIAPHLLTIACYDREVNCRRAASAAFQENVGRQGSFPHGIEIVNIADYFSLSSRQNSYFRVAVSIAQYKEYLYPFAEELLYNKVSHWDKNLRELAAEGLASLAKYDCKYFAGFIIDKLIPCTLSLDLCTRHGSMLAAGELVLALHQYGYVFPVDKQKILSNIVPAIEKARLYRGKGGEIMRSAVSRFIQCISLSHISLGEKTKNTLLDTLNENLKHPNAQIQLAAVNALKHFIPSYLVSSTEKSASETILKYLELLDDQNVAARRGAALAFGILPHEFLTLKWRVVATKLCSSCTVKDKPDDPDAEARVNAVRGLVSVCETLFNAWKDCKSEEDNSLYIFVKNDVMPTLFEALEDYAVDNRGDVGSWVREAAMDGLERCTYILCRSRSVIPKMPLSVGNRSELHGSNLVTPDSFCPFFDEKLATSLVGGISKQAVEKIDKIRDIAAKTLQRILHNENHFVPCIPHREILECIISSDAGLKWGDPAVSYPRFVQLLEISCYSRFVLSGLVISIGGLQESLRKASVSALLDFLQGKESGGQEERARIYKLCNDILWILEQFQKSDRIIIPTLKTIEILFSKKVFLNMKEEYSKFCGAIVNFLVIELKGSKDFTKLLTGLSIFGYIASDAEIINVHSFSQLLSFLGHRYPKIRKAAADQLYLVLLQNGNAVPENKMEKALEVLSETCWEAALEDARRGRQQLHELAGLDSGSSNKISSEGSRKKSDAKLKAADENSSYASLVGYSGF